MSEFDWSNMEVINARERFMSKQKLEPAIDMLISKIVSKKVFVQDPRLIALIRKWKQNKPENSMQPDNFLKDPEKIKELKKEFNAII